MELRGQNKEIEMPSSLVYHRESSSTPKNSAVGESDAILNPPQALDQQHPLLYNQLNPHHQSIHNKPRRDPELDIDPDPVPPSIATASVTPNRSNLKSPATAARQAQALQVQLTSAATAVAVPSVRYRECQKNHAANMGGVVTDGCGEFMPSGEDGTMEALKCAACQCHRNFHRKEIDGEPQYASNSYYTFNNPHRNNTSQRNMISHHHHHPHQLHPQHPPFQQHHRFSYASPPTATIAPMMMNFGGGGSSGGGAAESSSEDLNMFRSNTVGQTSVQPPLSKKRFRTKFSQEQKGKMLEFAEKLGWKMQKQDEQEVQQFCAQVGVKRQVFKVWMHNNKQATKKKQIS